jgi:cell wall-associated NlpC family hydrolase
MRIVGLLLALLVLAGCAAPGRTPMPAADEALSRRAQDEIAASRGRELVLYALSYVGVPYRYGGSSPDTGFDCSGLVHYVYSRAAGLVLPRRSEALSELGTPVGVAELEPGDLVFFNTLRRPYSHVGIYLGDQRFLHAPATGGQVSLVDLRSRYWQSRFNGARRLSL